MAWNTVRQAPATLCLLTTTDYAMTRRLLLVQDHEDLRRTPGCSLSQCFKVLSAANGLLSKGVDDCYAIPIDWRQLEQRLEFLNQYKPYLYR